MKIIRKSYAQWNNGIPTIIPPISMYILNKFYFNPNMTHEWIWWIFIPSMILIWLFAYQISIKKD